MAVSSTVRYGSDSAGQLSGCGRCGLVGTAGVCRGWNVVPVAPLFDDFRGKNIESSFPSVMVEYYRSLGRGYDAGFRGLCGRSDSSDDVSRVDRVGERNCGGVVDVSGERVEVPFEGRVGRFQDFVELFGGVLCGTCKNTVGSGTGGVSDSEGSQVASSGNAVGDGGSAGNVEVSGKTLANRQRRKERKERKVRKKSVQAASVRSRCASDVDESVPEWRRKSGDGGFVGAKERQSVAGGLFASIDSGLRSSLHESRAKRWEAENELAVLKARRQIELEQAKDMAQLKKCQETRLLRQTEVNKVQVEKAFASLARAGNVPGVAGCVETVVSGSGSGVSPVFGGVGSGSVSPNSSVSLAEIHALQKDNLSKQKDNEEMLRQLNHLKFLDPDMYKKIGGGFERAPTVDTGYTVDSQGQPIGEPPDTYWGGEVRADGKYHYITDEPFHLY